MLSYKEVSIVIVSYKSKKNTKIFRKNFKL